MKVHSGISQLKQRLPELEWYAKQQGLKVEPARYPKGLFSAAASTFTRYQLDNYVDEIKNDLLKMEQLESRLATEHLSTTVSQKINVLVNSFRSQHLRKPTQSRVDAFMQDVEQSGQEPLAYLCQTKQAKALQRLDQHIEKRESQLKALTQSLQNKEVAYFKVTKPNEKQALQAALLSLKEQIGSLNRTLTKDKEKRAEMLSK